MKRYIRSRDLAEAVELLAEVQSWSDDAVAALPLFYRQKAREYRRLPQYGEE